MISGFAAILTLLACGNTPAADKPTVAGESIPTWTNSRGNAGATGATSRRLPADLQLLWEIKTAQAIETTPVCDGTRVFVTDVMGGIEAIKLSDGTSIWRRDLDTGFVSSPTIYLPESENTSDEPIARVPTVEISADQWATEDGPLTEPLVVVGDVEGNVYGLDPDSGETRWTFTTEGEINAPANCFKVTLKAEDDTVSSGIRVLQTSQDGSLYCLSAKTGKLIWKYDTNDQIRCAASIGNGRTFLGGCDAGLHVVDLASGKAIGEPLSLEGPTGSTPAIIGNEVFVPIMDGILYAFDPESRTQRWQYEDAERPQDYRGDVAIGVDRVIIASRLKHIDAIDRKTGKSIWRITLRRRADASPLITGDEVWIASTDGLLLRLSLDDGSQRWSFEIKGGFFAAPAVVGDRLIIADDEGVVRCFGSNH